jgi:exonuclease III
MMVKRGINPSHHPRTQFISDLITFVTKLQTENHSIILMGDFNEEYESEPNGMPRVAAAGGLIDLMQERLGHSSFQTHIDGSKRIDYVLVSPCIMEACQAAGYDAFKTRFSKSDH